MEAKTFVTLPCFLERPSLAIAGLLGELRRRGIVAGRSKDVVGGRCGGMPGVCVKVIIPRGKDGQLGQALIDSLPRG